MSPPIAVHRSRIGAREDRRRRSPGGAAPGDRRRAPRDRVGKRRIAFAAPPAARELLYAFATAPSHHLTRAMIARALWGVEYDPLRHDSTIKSSAGCARCSPASPRSCPATTAFSSGYRRTRSSFRRSHF